MKKEYSTTDFWLAAFLKAKGLKLMGVHNCSKRSIFTFYRCEDLENLIQDFYNDGTIKISIFKNAFQDIKSSIYNFKE